MKLIYACLLLLASCKPMPLTVLPPVELPGAVQTDAVPNELRENLRIVCIEGLAYYYAKWDEGNAEFSTGYSVLAPKYDREGHPTPCTLEKEKK